MSNPDKFTKNVRYRTATFGVIAAGAQLNVVLVTPDDAERRLVTGFASSNGAFASNCILQLLNAGYRVFDVDASMWGNAEDIQFYVLDETYPPGIQININAVNNNAGATSGGDIVVIRYELPDHI